MQVQSLGFLLVINVFYYARGPLVLPEIVWHHWVDRPLLLLPDPQRRVPER